MTVYQYMIDIARGKVEILEKALCDTSIGISEYEEIAAVYETATGTEYSFLTRDLFYKRLQSATNPYAPHEVSRTLEDALESRNVDKDSFLWLCCKAVEMVGKE